MRGQPDPGEALRDEDPIALLLPDAEEEQRRRARRMTTFLRLLSSDARGTRAESAHIVLERAREDLDQARLHRVRQALEELLRAHLEHELGRDEYTWFGESRLTLKEAWNLIDDCRGEWSWLPDLPAPGEAALDVADRLMEALAREQGDEARIRLWRARVMLVRDGVEAACANMMQVARSGRVLNEGTLAEFVAGAAECLLTGGAPSRALEWLGEYESLLGSSPRLQQLLGWAKLLLGESIPGVHGGGPLPAPLCELRESDPVRRRCLPGVAASSARAVRWRPRSESRPLRQREALGASVLAVFSFQNGEARLEWFEAAPALRANFESWKRGRLRACRDALDVQHAMLVDQHPVEFLASEDLLELALGASRTRRLSLEPILDEEGEICGWLHLEFEHLAAPSRHGRREIAAHWPASVLHERASASEWRGNAQALTRARNHATGRLSRRARSEACEQFMQAAGLKLGRRHWWGFDLERGEPQVVAEGGEALLEGASRMRVGRAVRRSLATLGFVRWSEGETGMSVHPDARSGIVIPFRHGERALGCISVESTRRGDFRDRDIERLTAVLPHAAREFRLARFKDWHRETSGRELYLPAQREDFRLFADRVGKLARFRGPISICGPGGSGRQALGRWIRFESGKTGAPWVELNCAEPDFTTNLERQFELALGGFVFLRELDRASDSAQLALWRCLEGERSPRSEVRVLVSRRASTKTGGGTGGLRGDLELLLSRAVLEIPALRDRREDIPGLAACLWRRIVEAEQVPATDLSDELIALLWRQEWSQDVRELESILTRVFLEGGGEGLELESFKSILQSALDSFCARLPSRKVQAGDVLAALRSTRLASGRINKTRAAAYLGWDPDTLVVRMRDLGLGESELPAPQAWSRSLPSW